MFPLTSTCSGILAKMLSISVAEELLTRVGLSFIINYKEGAVKQSKTEEANQPIEEVDESFEMSGYKGIIKDCGRTSCPT